MLWELCPAVVGAARAPQAAPNPFCPLPHPQEQVRVGNVPFSSWIYLLGVMAEGEEEC